MFNKLILFVAMLNPTPDERETLKQHYSQLKINHRIYYNRIFIDQTMKNDTIVIHLHHTVNYESGIFVIVKPKTVRIIHTTMAEPWNGIEAEIKR